jgi:hypothetical protein
MRSKQSRPRGGLEGSLAPLGVVRLLLVQDHQHARRHLAVRPAGALTIGEDLCGSCCQLAWAMELLVTRTIAKAFRQFYRPIQITEAPRPPALGIVGAPPPEGRSFLDHGLSWSSLMK